MTVPEFPMSTMLAPHYRIRQTSSGDYSITAVACIIAKARKGAASSKVPQREVHKLEHAADDSRIPEYFRYRRPGIVLALK